MAVTRRELLRLLAASPLAAAAGGCCTTTYSRAISVSALDAPRIRPIFSPAPRAVTVASPITRVIDTHAHFFNASDVPVREFLQDCIGHSLSPVARRMIRAMAPLADRLAERAPSAAEETRWLYAQLSRTDAMTVATAQASAQDAIRRERQNTAERVEQVIRGSEFERVYRELKSALPVPVSTGLTSAPGILATVRDSESPSTDQTVVIAATATETNARIADGMLGFLFYMLSYRVLSLDAYIAAFRRHEQAFGVDVVLGSLVDFDYWLECPPRSTQTEQVALHALLAQLHDGFLRPIVAYNPWTDIEQDGAGLERVVTSFRDRGFVGVKIYPPTGFMPTGNSTTPVKTKKRRPDLVKLDHVLGTFFDRCAELRIPVIAHANRSNGRDLAHDEFSSPKAWRALFARYASRNPAPVINVGHFGGGGGSDWSQQFAALMSDLPDKSLFGDLGYWEELMCNPGDCTAARTRLKDVLDDAVGSATVADRIMFGSDWLMLSQVKKWADYPRKIHASLSAIAPPEIVAKILATNAERCFGLSLAPPPDPVRW